MYRFIYHLFLGGVAMAAAVVVTSNGQFWVPFEPAPILPTGVVVLAIPLVLIVMLMSFSWSSRKSSKTEKASSQNSDLTPLGMLDLRVKNIQKCLDNRIPENTPQRLQVLQTTLEELLEKASSSPQGKDSGLARLLQEIKAGGNANLPSMEDFDRLEVALNRLAGPVNQLKGCTLDGVASKIALLAQVAHALKALPADMPPSEELTQLISRFQSIAPVVEAIPVSSPEEPPSSATLEERQSALEEADQETYEDRGQEKPDSDDELNEYLDEVLKLYHEMLGDDLVDISHTCKRTDRIALRNWADDFLNGIVADEAWPADWRDNYDKEYVQEKRAQIINALLGVET